MVRRSLLKIWLYFHVLNSAILFANQIHIQNATPCFGELLDYVYIDPVSPQTVNDYFVVKARIPESAKKATSSENKQLIIAIDIQLDHQAFDIISKPLNILEGITKEGGEWEWKLKAKKSGVHTIDFRIGIIKNMMLVDNCTTTISINVIPLPVCSRISDWIANNIGLLISNSITLVAAIVGWSIALKKRSYDSRDK